MNDNKKHYMLDEFMFWQKKCDGANRFPRVLFKTKFDMWERTLANFIWFYKFEVNYKEKWKEIMKEKIKALK